jgi:5-methylcytosine-specific restriction endonuclease McrA
MEFGRQLRRKYEAIIKRSFKTKLDVFLFDIYLKTLFVENFSHEEFHHFEITDQILSQYEKAWQLLDDERLSEDGPQMHEIDNFIQNWHKQNPKVNDLLLNEYKSLFRKEYFPFSKFNELFDQDPANRECHYCKITDKDIELLRKQRRIKTKQLRGYCMELDRINSNREYRPENVVLACYWCNNAKSDEFTSSEFSSHIGSGIGHVWEERLIE